MLIVKRKETKMAQGEFTKEEAEQMMDAVNELFKAISKTKRMNYLGHLNDVCLFLETAKKIAPNEMT